ncbi:unnamed protein product [Leuciscus chuanchicus]
MKNTFKTVLFLLLTWGVFGVDAEVKCTVHTYSVMEGDSVTLNTNLTKIQIFNQIQWRFGNNGPVIAETDRTNLSSYLYHTEIFRGRLQLDNPIGSQTINNMRIKDTGLYKLQIDNNTGPLKKIFSVTVYEAFDINLGLSPCVIAGIVVGVLLLVFAVGASGVFYYRYKICKLERPNYAVNNTDRYMSQYSLITEDLKDNIKDGHEELQLDGKERLEDSAKSSHMCLEEHEAVTDEGKISEELSQKLHKVEISEKISQIFEEKTVIVKEGEDLTLNTDVKVQTDDQILWTFGA